MSSLKRKVGSASFFGLLHALSEGIVGVVQISLLWRYLSPADVGFWSVSLAAAGFTIAVGAAMAQAIARQHADEVGRSVCSRATETFRLAGRRLLSHLLLASIVFQFTWLGISLAKSDDASFSIPQMTAWILLCAAYNLRLFSLKNFGHLNGQGHVGKDKLGLALTAICSLIGTTAFLRMGLGLYAPALAALLAAAVLLVFSTAFMSKLRFDSNSLQNPSINRFGLLRKEMLGYVLMSVAAYAMTNMDIIIVEKLAGAEVVGSYAAQAKVALLISGLALIIPQIVFPLMAADWAASRTDQFRKCCCAQCLRQL